jgi:transposase
MRYEFADCEWLAIKPMLLNKPRGVPRVDDRLILDGGSMLLADRGYDNQLPHVRPACFDSAMAAPQ